MRISVSDRHNLDSIYPAICRTLVSDSDLVSNNRYLLCTVKFRFSLECSPKRGEDHIPQINKLGRGTRIVSKRSKLQTY